MSEFNGGAGLEGFMTTLQEISTLTVASSPDLQLLRRGRIFRNYLGSGENTEYLSSCMHLYSTYIASTNVRWVCLKNVEAGEGLAALD